MPLKEVDRVDILTVLDNTIDVLLASTEQVKRMPLPPNVLTRESPVAEHGFAALVTVTSGNTSESLLFDGGLSRNGLIHNMDVLDVKPEELHTIVLSHGHTDHTQGLMGMAERLGNQKMPLLLHPDAFLERKVVFPDGHELNLPPPDRRVLSQEGIEFTEERGPSYLLGGQVLVTGQIQRSTDFEKGFIRAEVVGYDDFIANKGEQGAKDAGKWRLEGKDYVVDDGDVVHFRFNV